MAQVLGIAGVLWDIIWLFYWKFWFYFSDLPSDVSYYSVDLYNRNKRSRDGQVGRCRAP